MDAMAAEADRALAAADRALAAGYPGPRPGRQPVHTAYLPADRFGPGLAAQWGRQALAALESLGAGPGASSADAMGLPDRLAADVRSRVLAKLVTEPVEDLRLDFEDGYGDRGDGAEDADARPRRRAPGGRGRRGEGPAVYRAALQEPGGGHPPPGHPHAGRVPGASCWRTGRSRPASW